MTFEIHFHQLSQTWVIWQISRNGSAEIVKRFKSERAAKNWVAKH